MSPPPHTHHLHFHLSHELHSKDQRRESGKERSMEKEGVSPSRPVIGFPVGVALFLILLVSLSAIMTFCFHRDKFRCLLRHSTADHLSDTQSQIPHSPPKSLPPRMWKQNQSPSLPVLMPGDEAPKLIAIPSSKIIIEVEKPPTTELAHMSDAALKP